MHHHYMCISKSVSILMFTVKVNTSVFWGVSFISFSDSVSKFKGVMLNAHCVEVSVVNNDAPLYLYVVFVAALHQLVSQVVVKYDHVCVHCGFVSDVLAVVLHV